MDSNIKVDAVILAAGEGTRMVSSTPKVLHPIMGKPMITYAIEAVTPFAGRLLMVVGRGSEEVKRSFEKRALFIKQPERRGTGDAIKCALPQVEAPAVLVLPGDMPFEKAETLLALGRYDEAKEMYLWMSEKGGRDATVSESRLTMLSSLDSRQADSINFRLRSVEIISIDEGGAQLVSAAAPFRRISPESLGAVIT